MKIKLGLGKANMEMIARWCGGELYDFTADAGNCFEYVCTDSREADENTMFVATRGERVDGHDYIIKAIEQGCRCILCEYVPTNISGKAAAYTVVENSIDAFADCARGYRAEHLLPTVAITGSVGKTTTKELTAAILRQKYNTYSTQGNFNSVIGMPMSLMEADGACETAVFEMGMSAFGEIRSMTRAACPKVAMVINIGSSHLEYLETRENIAKAKLEIAEGLSEDGCLLLNGDEPLLKNHRGKHYKTYYVGVENEKCDVRAENIRIEGDRTIFDLKLFDKKLEALQLPIVGKHFAYNAAFASAAASLMGAGEREIRQGLLSYIPGAMRMNIEERNGVTLLSDCYNAAPESMRAAIETLSAIEVKGRRIAVLGDMKELGRDSDALHRGVGKFLAQKKIDMLFTLGESGALIAEEAILCGMKPSCVFAEIREGENDALVAEIASAIKQGDAILFKASRAMRLETLIEALFPQKDR